MTYNSTYRDDTRDHIKNPKIVCVAINLPRVNKCVSNVQTDNLRPSTGSQKLMQIIMMYDTYELVGEG